MPPTLPLPDSLTSARDGLRPTGDKTVVRSVRDFFVVDTKPDSIPANFLLPDRLFVGSEDAVHNPDIQYTHILSLGGTDHTARFSTGEIVVLYKRIELLDLPESPLPIEECVRFLDAALGSSSHSKVLIHCNAGVSRSVSVAVAYYMIYEWRRHRKPSLERALAEIKSRRPSANPNEGFKRQLLELEKSLLIPERKPTPSLTELIPVWCATHHRPSYIATLAKVRFLGILFHQLVGFPTLLGATVLSTWLSLRRGRRRPPLSILMLLALSGTIWYRYSSLPFRGMSSFRASRNLAHLVPRLSRLLDYRPPLWTRVSADFTTISSTLAEALSLSSSRAATSLVFHREELNEGRIFIDWVSLPSPNLTGAHHDSRRCVMMLSGIGGDARSPYVQDTARHLLERGYEVCVLLARGFASSRLRALEDFFSPCDIDEDARYVIRTRLKWYSHIFLLGFSLGGVAVNRILTVPDGGGDDDDVVQKKITAAASISGSFSVEFIKTTHYTWTYQRPFIVPGLMRDILAKYGEQFRARLSPEAFDRLAARTHTYEEMHANLYRALDPDGIKVKPHFDEWRREMESVPRNVSRPLLLLASADDPLHAIELIGLAPPRHPGHAPFDPSEAHEHDNLITCITDCGGHVAFPESGFAREGYVYMRESICAYFDAFD